MTTMTPEQIDLVKRYRIDGDLTHGRWHDAASLAEYIAVMPLTRDEKRFFGRLHAALVASEAAA